MNENQLLIYKSSAGSGKTYTLVLEYLKLVLRRPSLYRSLLAITFTNKATAEMKSRIVGSLVKLSENKDPDLIRKISEQTGISELEIPLRAGKVLDFILHDYSGFSISTIDSFFSKIVRSLARELHLPLRFDFELDAKSVAEEITYLLLDDISKNQWLKKWLREFTLDRLDNDKGWKIEPELRKMAMKLFDENYRKLFPVPIIQTESRLIIELQKIKNAFESNMTAYSDEFRNVIIENNLTVEDFHFRKEGVAGWILNLSTKPLYEKYIPGKRFQAALESPQGWYSKSSSHAMLIESLASSKLMRIASKIQNQFESGFTMYVSALAVLNTAYQAGITASLDEKLKQFRDENNLMLLSDNNLLLKKAVSGQDAPFIYEKSGNRYTHFMLDEFQDTSDFQWLNLLPLVENALGSGQYTMIVGDAKQSIYRWRGGNMQLLLDGIQKNLNHFSKVTSLRKLDSNYRSREMIVSFNNLFFESAPMLPGFPAKELASNAYNRENIVQEWKKGNPGEGYVKITFFEDEKEGVDSSTGEVIQADRWKEKSAEETLKIIDELFSSGYQPSDIALLTRTNADAQEITSHLISNGITRIISPESMQLHRSPKVELVISLLIYINDPEDDLALSHAAYQWELTKSGTTAEGFHNIFAASRQNKLLLLPENFKKRLFEFRKLPLYELVEEISVMFNLNNNADAYIQRFLDVVIDYTNNNPPGIAGFLEWWDDNSESDNCSVIIPENENAIRIMSIHKSKGLQFPVVIIPYCDWKFTPKSDSLMYVSSSTPPFDLAPAHPVKITKMLQHSIFDSQYNHELDLTFIDNLNLMYVAFTRAEERLYMGTCRQKKDKPAHLNNASGLIFETLQSIPVWNEILEKNNGIKFEYGNAGLKESKILTADNQVTLTEWITKSWKDRLRMSISKNKISIKDPEPPETVYGNIFHAAAAEIFVSDDFDKVLNKFIPANPDHKIRLADDLNKLIEISMNYGWFGNDFEVLNEAELLLEDGSVVRPDRLLLKNKQAIVIDYKTGKEERFHETQVKDYAAALNKMGFEQVTIFLVYPALGKAVEIKAA